MLFTPEPNNVRSSGNCYWWSLTLICFRVVSYEIKFGTLHLTNFICQNIINFICRRGYSTIVSSLKHRSEEILTPSHYLFFKHVKYLLHENSNFMKNYFNWYKHIPFRSSSKNDNLGTVSLCSWWNCFSTGLVDIELSSHKSFLRTSSINTTSFSYKLLKYPTTLSSGGDLGTLLDKFYNNVYATAFLWYLNEVSLTTID